MEAIRRPVKVIETRLDSGIKKTEISGGKWDAQTMMYTTVEPNGVKTVHSFIPEFGVNRYSVKTESYKDGQKVVFNRKTNEVRGYTVVDKLKTEFRRWRTIGHLVSGMGEQLDVHDAGKPDTKLVLVEYKNMWQRDSRTQLNTMYAAPQTR